MQPALAIGQPIWDDPQRRLVVCMAISSAVVLIGLALLDWPPSFELRSWLPVKLELAIRRPAGSPEAGTRERPAPALPGEAIEPVPAEAVESAPLPVPLQAAEPAPLPLPAQAAAPADSARPAAAEPGAVAAPAAEGPRIRVDWYAELERAAAEVSARAAAEPQSMHPEFDELRRIAALRYGKPQGASQREKDEEDRPPRFRNLVNEYAFGTFPPLVPMVTIPFGRPKPKNLPWVETIRARYEYMREPDELPPIGVSSTISGVSATTEAAAPARPGGR